MPAHRKDEQADEMYQLYQSGLSLQQVATAFGVTRQSVFKMFKKRNFQLRNKQPLPFITFNGVRYTKREHGYWASTSKKRNYLHRDVWKFFKGTIPVGFDIHHIDGNKDNNDIKNLHLTDCSSHHKLHASTDPRIKATQFKKGRKGTHYPRKTN